MLSRKTVYIYFQSYLLVLVLATDNVPKKQNTRKTMNQNKYYEHWWSPNEAVYDQNVLASLPGYKFNLTDMIKFKIWPDAKVPFFIDDFSYDFVLRGKIRGYLENARTLTGLNFVELSNPPEDENQRWVFFVNRRGQLDCKDYSTKSFANSGVQKVIVGYDCLNNNGPMAAIVLALAGVPPQHNSPDRDRFINVAKKFILPDKRGLFKRLKKEEWPFHDFGYDYSSVGHYPSNKYTVDGSETITVKRKPDPLHPDNDMTMLSYEKTTYSSTDLQKIRMLYNNVLKNQPRMDINLGQCRGRNNKLKSRPSNPFRSTLDKRRPLLAILSSLEGMEHFKDRRF